MIDPNNPYLTAQEKSDAIALDVIAEYREEKHRMAQEGMPYSSASYWLLTFQEFNQLASASDRLDTLFSGSFVNPEQWLPECDVLLMEHDRVEAGEWDNFHHRFNPIGYQHVAVIGLNGALVGELPKSNEEHDGAFQIIPFKWEEMREVLKKHSKSAFLCENGINAAGIDLWDIPLKELSEYEDKRIYKRTYIFSSLYEELFRKDLGAIQAMYSKRKSAFKHGAKGFKQIPVKVKRKKNAN